MNASLRAAKAAAAAAAIASSCSPSLATDANTIPAAGTWFTQQGAVIINYRNKSEVSVNNAPVAGVGANMDDDVTLGSAYGYYITPSLSVMAVLGRGPEGDVTTDGGLYLGKVWYGAPSIVVDYHFHGFGALQPFIGMGATYLLVVDETDGFIQNLKVDDSLGFVLRAGTELMLDDHYGLFVAANKIFIDASARGVVDGAAFGSPGQVLPIAAEIELDPWIYQVGLTYRY